MLPNNDPQLEIIFPQLAITGYRITSHKTPFYNCIAWAADDSSNFWWPLGGYWPEGIERILSVGCFIEAYRTCGYEICENPDYENNYDKIVIFVDSNNIPTHASKQIDQVTWTSKLGKNHDISHTLYGLNSIAYGAPSVFMKRIIS